MNRLIAAFAALAMIGTPALADLYFTALGVPLEGGSFYQMFATRAGEWETFNRMKIEITSNGSFEQTEGGYHALADDLVRFYLAPGTADGPGNFDRTKWVSLYGSWSLSVDDPNVAVAGGSAIGGKWNWLVFTANFAGYRVPDQYNKMNFTATLYTLDGGSWVHDLTYFANYDSNGKKKPEVVVNSTLSFPCSEAGPVVPAPAAIVLGVIGLGALGLWRRRYC